MVWTCAEERQWTKNVKNVSSQEEEDEEDEWMQLKRTWRWLKVWVRVRWRQS